MVGLYLKPPDKALVLCLDEKSQVQALERTQPLLPMGFGYVEGVTHDYNRHGTNVSTSKAIGPPIAPMARVFRPTIFRVGTGCSSSVNIRGQPTPEIVGFELLSFGLAKRGSEPPPRPVSALMVAMRLPIGRNALIPGAVFSLTC